MRRTALIGLELAKFGIDVAGLSETRFADSGMMHEPASGYNYYWSGLPENEPRRHGVAIVMKKEIADRMESSPKAINERLMSARIPLEPNRYLTIICAYAPTMTNEEVVKESFYAALDKAVLEVHPSDKLLILGDMNARIGRDHLLWPQQLGKFGIGKCNSNGLLLLSKCAEHELAITNTWFQHPLKHKVTWMHPRSHHWHLIDYVIVRKKDLGDVLDTKVMRSADCDTDHQLLVSTVRMTLKRKVRSTQNKRIKLNVGALRDTTKRNELKNAMDQAISAMEADTSNQTLVEEWESLRDTALHTAEEILGPEYRKEPDWFMQHKDEIMPLIQARDAVKKAHLNQSTRASTARLKQANANLKAVTRQCQSDWIDERAKEIQRAADMNDMRRFHELTNEIYEPRKKGFASLQTADGSRVITDQGEVLNRWKEHFEDLLNRPSTVSDEAMANLVERPVLDATGSPPTLDEVKQAVKTLKSRKAAGQDGIPPEVFKYGGIELIRRLHKLFLRIWNEEDVPQQLKDATIVTIFKNKGSRTDCGNYRGISLLAIAGKVLAKIIQIRIVDNFLSTVSESQCGFRSDRSTVDMIFTARQLQEKCIEQNLDMYAVFIDLTKAFDTVDRRALWQVLRSLGCPEKLVSIIRQLHDGMFGQVCANGKMSEKFPITTGVKQGCVIAPILFVLFFAASQSTHGWRTIQYRTPESENKSNGRSSSRSSVC